MFDFKLKDSFVLYKMADVSIIDKKMIKFTLITVLINIMIIVKSGMNLMNLLLSNKEITMSSNRSCSECIAAIKSWL